MTCHYQLADWQPRIIVCSLQYVPHRRHRDLAQQSCSSSCFRPRPGPPERSRTNSNYTTLNVALKTMVLTAGDPSPVNHCNRQVTGHFPNLQVAQSKGAIIGRGLRASLKY